MSCTSESLTNQLLDISNNTALSFIEIHWSLEWTILYVRLLCHAEMTYSEAMEVHFGNGIKYMSGDYGIFVIGEIFQSQVSFHLSAI